MRVALDVSAVPERVAGAGRYVVELARRLPSAGVTTTLVTRRGDDRWAVWSPAARSRALVPGARVNRLIYEAYRLGTSEPAREAQVWHGPHYTMPRRGSTPTVVTIHDLTFFTNPQWHEQSKAVFFRRAITYAATHAAVLVCVSEFTRRQLDDLVPEHAPVVVAAHGVDLERFSPSIDVGPRSPELGRDVPYVLFVGTLEPRKGLDVLLQAFELIAHDDPEVELWIAGQVGWGVDELENAIGHATASSRIRRLGYVSDDDLPTLMRRASVVAYPSRGEGFGLPVLEAMACGALVVTSSDTVMAEVAGDGALLARVGDVAGLAEQLTTCRRMDDEQRAHRSRAARRRAEEFTWDASIARHLEAYDLARGSS